MRLRQTQSKVQNDAEISCEQSATADLSSLNSDLQKHAQQKDSGELKLKDSPGVGYPTLGRPWVAQGPGAFLLVGSCVDVRQAGVPRQAALNVEWKFRARLARLMINPITSHALPAYLASSSH